MSASALLAIAIAAVALLLLLVIKIHMSAFVALLLVSLGTGLAAGIPLGDIVGVMTGGMGKTLSSVMIIVGLGAMLGRVIEVAGGADSVAYRFTELLGVKKVAAGVTVAAFILSIPIFFDVGFIILAPIVFGFARVANLNPLKVGLPVAGVMLATHVVMPPHPGPVAAAEILNVNPGMQILLGLPIVVVACLCGYQLVKWIKVDDVVLGESPFFSGGSHVPGKDAVSLQQARDELHQRTNGRVPSAWMVVGLVLLPIVLIMAGTVGGMVTESDSTANTVLTTFGSSVVALLFSVLVVYLVLGRQQGWSLEKRGSVLDSALPAVAVIVFVTGAGGTFANILVESGIGKSLADALTALNMPIILAGFLISAALRASQGSATVAILTTAGLLAESIAQAGYTPVQATLVNLAICFGGLGLSHINDSGFWIVTKYLGLSVKDGLRTWTVVSTIFGVLGFVFTAIAFIGVSVI